MAYAKRKSRPKSSFRKRQPRRRGVSTFAVKRIVKRAISLNTETKLNRFVQNGSLFSPANAIGNSYLVTSGLWSLSPHSSFCAISQGDGESDRSGNQIKVKNVRLKVNFFPNPYDAVNNYNPKPMYIKMWIFSLRYSNQLTDVQSAIFNNFMDSNNSSVGISGFMQDLNASCNNDNIQLKKVIVRKLGYAGYGGTGSSASAQSLVNNDFKLTQYVSLDVTKYVKKFVRYNDNSATPSTDGTWCYVEIIPFDNLTTGWIVPAAYQMALETKYTDS